MCGMTRKPFRTTPALMLSRPGVFLLLGAVASHFLLQTGALDSGSHLVSDQAMLLIVAGVALVTVTLIATPTALFYTVTRTGDGPRRIVFVALNVLLLVVALVCVLALFVAITKVFFNPG